MEGTELRCYVFVNLALSSIQKGVQGNHACVEVGVASDYNDMYRDWAKNHKTLIYLQGGFHGEMFDQYKEFSRLCNKLDLPHSSFREDEETMNCMFTAFAGVVPSTVYDMDIPLLNSNGDLESDFVYDPISGRDRKMYPDEELAVFLRQFRLAL